jgi:hypothetical protein
VPLSVSPPSLIDNRGFAASRPKGPNHAIKTTRQPASIESPLGAPFGLRTK